MKFLNILLISNHVMKKKEENLTTVDKLLVALGEDTTIEKNKWAENDAFHGLGDAYSKRWMADILPSYLLKLSVKDAVNIIATLSESGMFFDCFPKDIETPNYGDKWGRLANYIEINNRAIATMDNGCTCSGILSCIKLLPAIPPSAKSWANCVTCAQICRIFMAMHTKKDRMKKIQFMVFV